MSALRKVLVVDDDPVVGRSIDRVLSAKGYAVITAETGREALNKLGHEDYDVVFTDIKMPGMNGLEVAERVKARQPWLPVVIITGYGSHAHEARAQAVGVSGFLRKPLSPDMIEHSAQEALRERDAAAAAPRPAEDAGSQVLAWLVAPPAPGRLPATKARRFAANLGLFIVSPLIGLAYVVLFPIIGLATLAWIGVRALVWPLDRK